jgi:nitrate/TMAO reductase-like tetraheme cytochrome c subunit
MEFCVSCHEMRTTVLEEYKKTVHYINPSGIRAICSDGHVPREWTPKLIRRIKTANELHHKIMGIVDTPEKFEAERMELAENVWRSMEAKDSRECRSCHSFAAMEFHNQKRRAREKTESAAEKDKTCIECRKGIAHKLPAEYEEDD